MKKRILSLLFVMLMLLSASVTAFAAAPKLMFESSFDADTGLVSVNMLISNAVGIESGDLALAFDSEKLSFVEATECGDCGAMVISGLSMYESDVCSCSFIFADQCTQENLDENGNLVLATYRFKPIADGYDDDDFCFWAKSLDTANGDIASYVKKAGNQALAENRAGGVRVDTGSVVMNGDDGTPDTDAIVSKVGSNWYVYLIAVLLAIGAIVGIALVAVKGGEKNSDENRSDSESSDENN